MCNFEVSIGCTITVFACLWRCQGGIKREPAAPGGPGGAQGVPQGLSGCSQGVPQGVSGCSFSVSGFSFGVSERSSSCFSDLRTVPSRLQTLLRSKFHENLLQSYFKVLFRGRRQWPQASRMCNFQDSRGQGGHRRAGVLRGRKAPSIERARADPSLRRRFKWPAATAADPEKIRKTS